DEAWVFRGKILEEMGNALEAERCYEEALQCFHASLEIEPDNAELRYHQAVLLEDLERIDEAIDGYAASASKAHGADAPLRLPTPAGKLRSPGVSSAEPTPQSRPSTESRRLARRHFSFARTFTPASVASRTRLRIARPRSARPRSAASSRTGERANCCCGRVGRRKRSRRSTPPSD